MVVSACVPDLALAQNVIHRANVSGSLGNVWKHMDSAAALYDNGNVNGITKIWSSSKLLGWIGATKVIFADENGIPIGQKDVGSWGVDGTWIGKSSRWETWSAHAVPGTKYILLQNYPDPHNGFIKNVLTAAWNWFISNHQRTDDSGPVPPVYSPTQYGAIVSSLQIITPRSGTHGTVSFFRLNNGHDHFYTTSQPEANNAVTNLNFLYEGIAGYLYPQQQPNTVPLYRYYNPHNGDHFYTISLPEGQNAVAHGGYNAEGTTPIAGYLYPQQQPNTVPFYRYYNSHNGDHFYTTSLPEGINAASHLGYKDEDIAGYLYGTAF
jgi:Repeat of unknown function (DUF5648)